MDIVVRTPHGDADVSIASRARTTTLGEVVAAVTGQAVPRLVLVDGRAVDAAALLDDVELRVGSVIISEPAMPIANSDADVDLVQIAGHGAGRTTRLAPGRYRIGPGRRSNADELDVAPVERTVFELVVEPTASASDVTVVPRGSDALQPGDPGSGGTGLDGTASGVTIDGVPVEEARSWQEGTLAVGARAFQFHSPARSTATRTPTTRSTSTSTARSTVTSTRTSIAAPARSAPERDGTVAFSRPPRRSTGPDRRPIVDALHDAETAATTLWERRPIHPDAFIVPIGVRLDDGSPVSADLASNRAVAITGSERFRGALVRSLVVEAVTLHGPADLDLVVLTHPDRVGDWDWAKWLPHLRQGGRLDGPPAIWSSRHDIARWSQASHRKTPNSDPALTPHLDQALAARPPRPPRTLVILDDPGLWNRRDAPARSIVSDLPDHLRLIALCDDDDQAPDICTSLISATGDDLARLHTFTGADDEVFRPALTESGIAVRVARALAPLADADLAPVPTPADADERRITLPKLVGATEVDQVLTRWASADPPPRAAIGRRGREIIDVPVAADVTVVVGPSMGDAFDVAATSLVAQCAGRSPDALWIAPMMLGHSLRSELLWQLPHATDRHDVDSTVDPRRLLARLRAVLADPGGPERIVVVTEAPSGATATADETWLATMAAGVRDTGGLAMVVVTDRPDLADALGDTVIRVERRYDEPGTARRIALLDTDDVAGGQPFTPLQPTGSVAPGLALRPFVVGRALTSLERRIENHRAQTSNTHNPAFDPVIAVLGNAATRHARSPQPTGTATRTTDGQNDRRTVVPAPIPTRVDLDELFARSPGDGVPIGLADDPEHAGARTRWWEPGSGSLLVFGSRRSGMEQAITTILLGAIDRFSALDVRLVVIDPSPGRRRALTALDHPLRLVDPDRRDELNDALDEVSAELERCAATNASAKDDAPRMVLLIGDLVHLRRRHADQPVGMRVDDVLTRAAATGSGVDIVAAAADLGGAGPFAAAADRRLVGASSDHRELAVLGVEFPSDVDGIVGRCRSFPDGVLVQLATTDATFEALLARRVTGGAT